MAAPSISGGFTMLDSCDGNPSPGKTFIAPLAGSTPIAGVNLSSGFSGGLGNTGHTRISNSNGGNGLQGGIHALAQSTDFSVSNRLCVFHSHGSTNVDDLAGSSGVMLYVNSGSTGSEEAAFPVFGRDAPMPADYSASVVNLNRQTDAHIYSGSFDSSDVTHIGVIVSYASSYNNVWIDSIGYIDPYTIIEGDVTTPGNFSDILSKIDSDDTKLSESPTANIHHCYFPFGAGDGTSDCYVRETLKTFEFARAVNFSEPWGRAHINDNDLGFELNAASINNIEYELCNWISDTPFYWRSIGSSLATINFISCVIKNAGALSIVDGHNFNGCTFDGCASIAVSQPSFTNTAFKNASASALTFNVTNGDANITNCIFSDNQTAVRVDVSGGCALDVTEFTFETSNAYYIEYTGTETLTVTSPVSIDAGKLNASGGGTINVVSPTVDLTITSSETALIQVYNASTQTLLASTTGTSLTYTHNDENIDWEVKAAGFILQRDTGVSLYGNVNINVNLETDFNYNASHGLTYTTDFSYSRATKELTIVSTTASSNDLYSALIDAFIAQTSLRNTAFNFAANGTSLYLTDGAEAVNDTHIGNLTGEGGVRYLDATDTVTAEWCGIITDGIPAGVQAEYQQQDGTGTTGAASTGDASQQVKIYGDATHGNFDYRGHMVWKTQANGYLETRIDVLAQYATASLEPISYVLPMAHEAISITTGDPGITGVTITKEATPQSYNGGSGAKDFSITILDSNTNSAEDIRRWIKFNLSGDGTFEGLDKFNWPEMVLDGETARGVVEGDGTPTFHGVFVTRDGTSPHPDFARFQADDGTYTSPLPGLTLSGFTAGSRVYIYNETTDTDLYNAKVAGASLLYTYTEGVEITDGDTIKVYTCFTNSTNSYDGEATALATTGGFSVLVNETEYTDYATKGIDGSLETEYVLDGTSLQLDINSADNNWDIRNLSAWYRYQMFDSAVAIKQFFNALNTNNGVVYEFDTDKGDLLIDNLRTDLALELSGYTLRRKDGLPPYLNPTTGGGHPEFKYRDDALPVETGVSGLTPIESSQLANAAQETSITTVRANQDIINNNVKNGSTYPVLGGTNTT